MELPRPRRAFQGRQAHPQYLPHLAKPAASSQDNHGIIYIFFCFLSWWGKDTQFDQRLQTKAPALPSGERKIKGLLSSSDHRISHRTPKELQLLDRLQMHDGFSLNLSFSFPLPSTPSARDSWLLALRSRADKGLGEGERAQPS